MSYEITFPPTLRGTTALPASKSISARALVLAELAGSCALSGLSDCDDTQVLQRAFREKAPLIDIKAAGTAMRFSTAFFAATPGEHTITGTARMKQRPISILVDALRTLGAEIGYGEQEGFPPLHVKGRTLRGGTAELSAEVSSQYVSALLMIGPALSEGLTLRLLGEIASKPYIDMTLGLMRHFGAEAGWTGSHELRVAPRPYAPGTAFAVEPDWSAASYWYEMVALSPDSEARVFLPGLQEKSLQGDSAVARLFSRIGVETEYRDGGVALRKNGWKPGPEVLEEDFTACPDLAQTLVVACAVLGQPFRFTGLQSLKIKETDRILALQAELAKLGIRIEAGAREISFLPAREEETPARAAAPLPAIDTYDDHRMAMAFAPCALRLGKVRINHPEVVSKSYPAFWDDLRRAGASVTPCSREEGA